MAERSTPATRRDYFTLVSTPRAATAPAGASLPDPVLLGAVLAAQALTQALTEAVETADPDLRHCQVALGFAHMHRVRRAMRDLHDVDPSAAAYGDCMDLMARQLLDAADRVRRG